MELKEKLKILRKENKYTQEEVACLLSISSVGYGDYERGKSTPDIYTLKKLALIYKISLDELMKDTNDQSINIRISDSEIKTLESILKKINCSRKLNEVNKKDTSTNNIQIGDNNSIKNSFNRK